MGARTLLMVVVLLGLPVAAAYAHRPPAPIQVPEGAQVRIAGGVRVEVRRAGPTVQLRFLDQHNEPAYVRDVVLHTWTRDGLSPLALDIKRHRARGELPPADAQARLIVEFTDSSGATQRLIFSPASADGVTP